MLITKQPLLTTVADSAMLLWHKRLGPPCMGTVHAQHSNGVLSVPSFASDVRNIQCHSYLLNKATTASAIRALDAPSNTCDSHVSDDVFGPIHSTSHGAFKYTAIIVVCHLSRFRRHRHLRTKEAVKVLPAVRLMLNDTMHFNLKYRAQSDQPYAPTVRFDSDSLRHMPLMTWWEAYGRAHRVDNYVLPQPSWQDRAPLATIMDNVQHACCLRCQCLTSIGPHLLAQRFGSRNDVRCQNELALTSERLHNMC